MAKPRAAPQQRTNTARAKPPTVGPPPTEPPIVVEPQWLLRAGLLVLAAAFVCGVRDAVRFVLPGPMAAGAASRADNDPACSDRRRAF